MDNILERYSEIVGMETISELQQLAKILKGAKILHINSTKSGGGVAEILSVMTPLTNALGIQTEWETINGSPLFFQFTKSVHNALQGKNELFENTLFKEYETINAENAETLRSKIEKADVIFIHDPQPAALIRAFPQRKNKWIWRCHIDVSKPQRQIWKYFYQSVSSYDASIFSLKDFVQYLPHPIYLIPPSIDPLSEKNMELPPEEITQIYTRFEIDPNAPLVLQVSRFDHFKDPVGVIRAFNMAKRFRHDMQLVLAGGGAPDDPESESVLAEVRKAAKDDPSIHVLFLPADSHRTINALQRAATISIQKSIREGFGLTVTEALWKHKPVIGGNTGGIRLQVVNHYTGFLVNSPEGAALRIRYLLQNPELVKNLGDKGHRFVHDQFLTTRHIRDYLTVAISLLHAHNGRIDLQKLTA